MKTNQQMKRICKDMDSRMAEEITHCHDELNKAATASERELIIDRIAKKVAYEADEKQRSEFPEGIKKLLELYDRSTLVKHSAPDEYQFNQNRLIRGLAEFILKDYFEDKKIPQ